MAWRNLDIDHLITADLIARRDSVEEEPHVSSHLGASEERVGVHNDLGGRTAVDKASPGGRSNGANQTRFPWMAPSTAEKSMRLAAEQVVDLLRRIDRDARRAGRTIPTRGERDAVAASFWWALRSFAAIDERVPAAERASCAAIVR